MRIEHFAVVMEDPVAAADWYVRHLGFRVRRASREPPFGHFLADASGSVLLEIYNNPAVRVPDYRAMDVRQLHLAFAAAGDLDAEVARLCAAGATPAADTGELPDGERIVTLRDPWGFPIQFARRPRPLV